MVGLLTAYVLLRWVLPIAILVVVAIWAASWAARRNRPSTPTFSATEPRREEHEEYWPLEPGASSDRDADIHVPDTRR